MIIKDNLTKDEIEEIIYDEELDYIQLLKIKNQMKKYDFSKDDYEYVDEMLEDCYDAMSEEALVKAKEKISNCNLEDTVIDKFFKRKGKITEDTILKMNNSDIEYIINEGNLKLEQLLFIKSILYKLDLDEEVIDELNEQIDIELEDIIKFEELENAKKLFEKYEFPTTRFKKLKEDLQDYLENGSNDQLLKGIDNYIENLPRPVLEEMVRKAKEENNEEDYIYYTNRIKKQDNLNKELDEFNNNLEELNSNLESVNNTLSQNEKKEFWKSLFGNNKNSNSDPTLMPWEQDQIDNGNYEPFNFEEEELEEDDYYYEDDNE